jgi:diamine N-acetyltransferase
MSSLRVEEVTAANVSAACGLAVRPGQEAYVAPVAWSLAAAYASPDKAWPRLVYDGDDLVGFVMGGFDPGNEDPALRSAVWRLNVAGDRQGRGYGRFAVDRVAAEARRRGQRRLTVRWVPGPGSPEGFYLRVGFRPTGAVVHGEIEGELFLAR